MSTPESEREQVIAEINVELPEGSNVGSLLGLAIDARLRLRAAERALAETKGMLNSITGRCFNWKTLDRAAERCEAALAEIRRKEAPDGK